ncbi:MAG: RdgB/HAM1 family non-canonical purine NTP pyrophosphatase [Saprospiraceae bacterium]|nr:RdgB/HAM1 family non-canonical purine NTP pyrophosphatase [Saprospiraceae bacterium]
MKEIIFATGNPNKVREVNALLPQYEVKSLKDIGCTEEVPETTGTIEGNALQKAEYVHEHYQVDCFSEDTGLEIEALNGEPGVDTAFYAGPQRSAQDNMALVLRKLKDQTNRKARFRTVVALIIDGQKHTFEGICNGHIAEQVSGTEGFGYDPVFVPEGYNTTFAEMEASEKNKISHRARAIAKLKAFLNANS